ncbi:3-dehydroquinate synthase [Candidatus Thiomargarita nelsonii]|uniref:3-dehydroquinate synthase n=1 Tax=Candidatus Thiomargarita nelsonii TaxID=1003181 RepID=A0A0A6PDZ4_9GAMM|nr:3-dehydroquinate synthase [Candidatus Thiomargarita nelsonii]
MKKLQVDLGARSYPIYIGEHLLGQTALTTPYGQQVLIVTNETVAPLYLKKTLTAFANFKTDSVILPDGEKYKNLTVLNKIFDTLLSQRFDRQTTLVALGGGVVGDMTGFAAACYQRGVPFIQIPTTLLAQVDSSVGGKTGVNHPLGKNMIGAFHQPLCVVIDLNTLQTLDDRQLSAGLAEVIKYGLINDLEFFEWLESHAEALLARDFSALSFAIARSCQDKANIVAKDERESGQRALLNLGHTFGHAIETGLGYGVYLHGEGVAIGMCLAAQFSARLGWMSETDVTRIKRLIEKMVLPTRIPKGFTIERMLELMQVDKKVQAGKLRLVLLQGIGKAIITDQYDPQLLRQSLKQD